jgi:hypothetical protein
LCREEEGCEWCFWEKGWRLVISSIVFTLDFRLLFEVWWVGCEEFVVSFSLLEYQTRFRRTLVMINNDGLLQYLIERSVPN